MKAILKRIHSPDIFDLQNFNPDEPDNFCALLQLIVSPTNNQGEESFDVMLCTPLWLVKNHPKADILFGRHYLIVFEYNYTKINEKLRRYVESIEANTWEEIALRIGQIGKWEFEDYRM